MGGSRRRGWRWPTARARPTWAGPSPSWASARSRLAAPGQGSRGAGPGARSSRLVIELRLAGAHERASAEPVLAAFLPRYNACFAVPPDDPLPAWQPVPDDVDLEAVCAFRYERVVANDATVRIGGLVLDLPRPRGGRSLAGTRVEVRLELDGRIVVTDGERVLLREETDIDPGRLRDLERHRFSLKGLRTGPSREVPGYPPRQDHPWRRVTPGSKLEAELRDGRGLTESLISDRALRRRPRTVGWVGR